MLYRPLLALAFNREKAATLRMHPVATHAALMVMLAVAIVASFQSIGTLLVFGLLIGPPATATLLVHRVAAATAVSVVISATCVTAGLAISYHHGTAGGATIAGLAVLVFFVVFAIRESDLGSTSREIPSLKPVPSTAMTTPPAPPASDDGFLVPEPAEALAQLGMPLADAMRTQRAVRRLHLAPVSHEVLLPLLELSLKAPTSSNTQDWCYVVVEDPDQKEQLARLYRRLFRLFNPVVEWQARRDEKALRQMRPGQWQAEHFAELPVFVVPCYRRGLKHRPVGRPQISVASFTARSSRQCRTCCWRAGRWVSARRSRRYRSGMWQQRGASWASPAA